MSTLAILLVLASPVLAMLVIRARNVRRERSAARRFADEVEFNMIVRDR